MKFSQITQKRFNIRIFGVYISHRGFAGLLVFLGMVDEGGVEAASTRYIGGSG